MDIRKLIEVHCIYASATEFSASDLRPNRSLLPVKPRTTTHRLALSGIKCPIEVQMLRIMFPKSGR